ncbi:hypothetical protein M2164_003478 [Streptomyces sp. SAI-208]|nr:hypothetical protein [Streptomyces sp. SAI-208]
MWRAGADRSRTDGLRAERSGTDCSRTDCSRTDRSCTAPDYAPRNSSAIAARNRRVVTKRWNASAQ